MPRGGPVKAGPSGVNFNRIGIFAHGIDASFSSPGTRRAVNVSSPRLPTHSSRPSGESAIASVSTPVGTVWTSFPVERSISLTEPEARRAVAGREE